MVRSYKKKTDRADISEENVKKAIKDIKNKTESISSAALKYDLNRTTLSKRFKKYSHVSAILSEEDSGRSSDEFSLKKYSSKYTAAQVFTTDQERELSEYFKKCAKNYFGLTYISARYFVYEYALQNNIRRPKSWDENKTAGIDWLKGFMKRNSDLILRKPESTSLARINAFSKENVMEFFSNLRPLYEKYKFTASKIYNLDETGLTTVLPSPKVIATKGERRVGQVSSAERGALVTMVGIINAAGNSIPPVYIFPRKRYQDRFVHSGPEGCIGLVSKSGWMTSELFLDVLKHIKEHSNCAKESPILLILDNHHSHCSLSAINFCRDNGIVMMSFPPHTSHRLQPLDVAIYGPFKKFCSIAFNEFSVNNPGKAITIYEIARLSRIPFYRSFSNEHIIKAFESTGIWPFNSLIFPESDFMAPSDECDLTESVDNNVINEMSFPQAMVDENQNRKHNTPEQVRPCPKIKNKRKVSARTGKCRVFTSTPEKNRIEDFELLKSSKSNKRINISKKRKQKPVIEYDTSSLDEDNFSTADTINSMGPMSCNDDSETNSNIDDLMEYRICDTDTLKTNDYVLVKFNATEPVYYIGEIIKILSENQTFEVNFLRKKYNSWRFYQPVIEDISLVLRQDIELKLSKPLHPPGTSRSVSTYIFSLDLRRYNVR